MITLLVLLVILHSLTVSFVKRVSCLGTRQAQVGEDVAFSESLGIELNIYRAEVAPFKNHLVFNSPNPSFTWTLFAGTCTRADRKASAALDPDEQADRIQIVEHMTGVCDDRQRN